MNNPVINKNGATIIELFVAISVTLMLSSLIFSTYLNISKQFKYHTKNAEKVMTALMIRKRIDNTVKDIREITATYKTSIEYLATDKSEKHVISFKNKALYKDDALLAKNLKSFKYSISEKKSDKGTHLLLWEAVVLDNFCWIGGASEVMVD